LIHNLLFSNNELNQQNWYLRKATLYKAQGNFEKALFCCKKILELNSRNWVACLIAGYASYKMGKYQDAVNFYKEGLKINEQSENLWFGIGVLLDHLCLFEDALRCYKRALSFRQDYTPALWNTMLLLKKNDKPQEALYFCKKALQLDPENEGIKNALGYIYLTLGQVEKGWLGWSYERKDFKGGLDNPQLISIDDIDGKTILIPDCWGLGDRIQFIKFAKFIQDNGGKVLVHLPKRLVPIFSRCKYVDQIITDLPKSTDYDFYINLWELPILFDVSMDDVPQENPYFQADPRLVYAWGETLRVDKHFKIGICWSGSGLGNKRDIPLKMFCPLSNIPGVSLYSLQKVRDCDQLKNINFNVHDFGDELDEQNGAFSDTAAIMKHLDLVITVDTSVAHLAGALGVPVWVMLPFDPDWRWFTDRSDSPWYPTMKLFRARRPHEWDDVMKEVAKELKGLVK